MQSDNRRRLERDFFRRDTVEVARDLLGRRLVRVVDGERLSGRIVETEAYVGQGDEACHASAGRTKRNASMFGPPGHAYVYFIYGMYYCLNFVTETAGFPAAVLIRALEPLEGVETMRENRDGRAELTSGPGRLCQALAIDKGLDGADLCADDALLFVEEGVAIPDEQVERGPRIGVRGDEKALTIPWRFYVQDNDHVSR